LVSNRNSSEVCSDKNSILKSMKDVYGIYGVTDFWDAPNDPQNEVTCGKNICDCIKESKNIQHFIFSGLPCAEKLIKYKCAPFCNKAEISDYAKSLNLSFTEIYLSFYY